jgi:hypothetical protein
MLWLENHLVVVVVCVRYLVGGEAGEWVSLGDRGSGFMGEMEVKTAEVQGLARLSSSEVLRRSPIL